LNDISHLIADSYCRDSLKIAASNFAY